MATAKISLSKGGWIDILSPKVWKINILDIAQGLSNICRWTGQGPFYSVAEHSVLVSRAVSGKGVKLAALLHDAAEAYMTDLSAPLKKRFPYYRVLEKKLRKMILQEYCGFTKMPKIVWVIDTRLAATEHAEFFGYERRITRRKPLPVEIGLWTPTRAKREFLKTFYDLVKQ